MEGSYQDSDYEPTEESSSGDDNPDSYEDDESSGSFGEVVTENTLSPSKTSLSAVSSNSPACVFDTMMRSPQSSLSNKRKTSSNLRYKIECSC